MVSSPHLQWEISLKTLSRRPIVMECLAVIPHRGDENCRPDIGVIHTSEAQRGPSSSAVRAGSMQTALSRNSQSLLVRILSHLPSQV